MATNDVPGANPANGDALAAGCWAEHEDGSLIFVKGTEGERVVYEIYDLSAQPPVSYTDAMPEAGFKKAFSWQRGKSRADRWTWHDKTAFPWERVIAKVQRPRPDFVTAEDQLSAAARVAQSLQLRGQRLAEAEVTAQTEQSAARGRSVLERIEKAITDLKELVGR